MWCRCYACKENENGQCTCENYIEIDSEGQCDHMWIVDEEPEYEEED